MPLKMKYFVLKPGSKYPGDIYAKASRMAMHVYASWIFKDDPEMSKDIAEWARNEEIKDIELGEKNDKDSNIQD